MSHDRAALTHGSVAVQKEQLVLQRCWNLFNRRCTNLHVFLRRNHPSDASDMHFFRLLMEYYVLQRDFFRLLIQASDDFGVTILTHGCVNADVARGSERLSRTWKEICNLSQSLTERGKFDAWNETLDTM